MSTQTAELLSPFNIGTLELENRVVLAPMTRARAGEQRIPNDLMAKYYAQRASAGLIITEATVISEQANGWVNSSGIYSDEMMSGWKQVVESIHAAGGKVFMQLWHCGRASHSSFHNGELPVAPSPIRLNGEYVRTPTGKQDYETPRALETSEVVEVVNDYQRAALRAVDAGFDGIEIHSANGYLLDEFLQSKTNQREDQYGGSPENRYRILDEVVRAVISEWGPHRVGVRLSPNGVFNDMGSPDYRETFTFVAAQLNKYELAYLHVMDGLAFGFHELGEPMSLAEFRKVFDGPLMGNCGYTQDTAQQAISTGQADMIAFGRPFISNPDLVQRFKSGWPLAELADIKVWYSHDESGYADFPDYKST